MLAAMSDYNATFSTLLVGRESFTDHISLREDLWRLDSAEDSDQAFQDRLRETLNETRGVYEITLNTLVLSRDLNLREDQGAFFVGPTYDKQGNVLTAGRYLDKIDWIKFQVIDPGLTAPQTREASFSYGGISYARTEYGGRLDAESAEATGELVSFPFRYYRPESGRRWTSQPKQQASVQITYSPQRGEPALGENSFWRERSVAATQWKLEIAQDRLDPDSVDDLVIHVRHNAALRQIRQ